MLTIDQQAAYRYSQKRKLVSIMKQLIKYKKLARNSLLSLSLLVFLALSMNSSALAAPFNYVATSIPPSPCSKTETVQPGATIDSTTNRYTQYTCCPTGTQNNDLACLFAKYINPLISLLSAAVGLVVVIAVIIGGIEYSSSGGDPLRAAAGRTHITNALLGLLAYILLYAFLQFLIPGGFLHG